VIDWSGSQQTLQLAQLLILAATAVFIGSGFLPPRYRQRVGGAFTVGYLAAVAAFAIYLLMR
jgi:ABC-type transport system involved in cytochrome c biogenesis permease subunit